MKVLQVLNHFLPKQTAGTEVYTWALSKQLQQRGISVQVLIPLYKKTTAADYVYDYLAVHQYAEPSVVDRSLIKGFRAPEGLRHFISYLQEKKPEIVHFHELSGSNGITLHHVKAAKLSGAKVIMTFHLASYSCMTGSLVYKGSEPCDGKIDLFKCSICYLHEKRLNATSYPLTFISSFLRKLSIDPTRWNNKFGTALGTTHLVSKLKFNLFKLNEYCDQFVCIADWYRSILIRNGISVDKIKLIPQGLPFYQHSLCENDTLSHSKLKLLFLGRISKFKGLHLLIDAMLDLDPAKVELAIYGSSTEIDYEAQLREKSRNFNNIHWQGLLKQEDVIPTMMKHHALCLCSTFSEMSPLVIQEAKAARIPVVASNVYGNAEQIKDYSNGLLFKFNDSNDLKNKIQFLIDNMTLFDHLKKEKANINSFDKVAQEYQVIYKNLVG